MSAPTELHHHIIRASAGSGKTYELVRRLIMLLSLDVKPESIVALTFTRKAAGEFFARLLQRLADAAENPAEAGRMLPELGADPRKKSLHLLRELLLNMDRLRLGTLDSFFAAMVQCVPFELGLTGMGALMSEDEKRQAGEEVMDAALVELMRPENEAARRELVEAWKAASLGGESNAPARDLAECFKELHDWFMECPDVDRWGDGTAIWADKTSPIWMADEDLDKAKAELMDLLVMEDFNAGGVKKWIQWWAEIDSYQPGKPLKNTAMLYMLDPDRGNTTALGEGRGEWMMHSRTVKLTPAASLALHRVLQIIIGKELKTVCERTKGRSQLVGIYERLWQRLVRGKGRLTFADLSLLLTGKLSTGTARTRAEWQEHWAQLRQDMEYRLNARYDHWLFDEFQDTSVRQWRVFENLVDEIFQDPEEQRSFFAVGDLKQSIYLWREAEPELFLGVEKRYESERLKAGSLRVSWRSSPEVLAMVNDTFADPGHLQQFLPGALEWWQFERHEASLKTGQVRGHATFLNVPEKDDRETALIALLKEIQPVSRGLTCAVLVRKNDSARNLSAVLRAALDCEVVCESEQAIATDNPVTLVLLSLLQVAAHPDDHYAWNHVRMTPLRKWLDANGKSRAQVGAEVRHLLTQGGFLSVAELWADRLREVCTLDAFSTWRLRQFLELAAEFDATGSREVDAFLTFARDYRAAGAGGSRAIQVMTIHKSKGLEFDVVLMPELQGGVMDSAVRQKLLWRREDSGEVAWMLDKPAASILEWDGQLVADVDRQKARAAFESLCGLYVAMTRAKQGLYLLHHTGKNTSSRSEAGMLQAVLAGQGTAEEAYPLAHEPELEVKSIYQQGARDWYEQRPLINTAAMPVEETQDLDTPSGPSLGKLLKKVIHPVQRRTPSGEEVFRLSGRELLSPRRESSRTFGTLVHLLFSDVPWVDGMSESDLFQRWEKLGRHQVEGYDKARALVSRALLEPGIRAWFEARGKPRVCWSERPFDMVLKDDWISGVFDRVVLEKNAAGRWASAKILDFKTDAVTDEASMQTRALSYEPQLKLYRQAVQKLTGLTQDQITCALIFTAVPHLREVREVL